MRSRNEKMRKRVDEIEEYDEERREGCMSV